MKIVVLDGYTLNPGDQSWAALEQLGDVTVYERTAADQVVDRCREAEAVLTNKTPIDARTIDQLPGLKFIGVLATGYNVVDTEAAKRRRIPVSNVPGYGMSSVVQLTFALLLEWCFHVQKHSDSVRAGDWSASRDFSYHRYPLMELSGKTMGIIGYGDIGRSVGSVALALGMKVIGNSRSRRNGPDHPDFRWAELPELLRESDVVSIHCPLLPETLGLINAERLSWMKPGAFLINTSRGPIIVEQDLADALERGVIAGAGIDVLSVEPPPATNPLLSAKNCLITPHIAWATVEARGRLMQQAVQNLDAFKNGTPTHVVNPW